MTGSRYLGFAAGLTGIAIAATALGLASGWVSSAVLGEAIIRQSQGAALVAVCLTIYLMWDKIEDSNWAAVSYGVLVGSALAGLYWVISGYVANLTEYHTWDFFSFYLFGSVGDAGLAFYERQSFEQIVAATDLIHTPEPVFFEVLYNFAFPYPPQSMWYFLPIGGLEVPTANLIWNIANAVTLVLAMLLFARFLRNGEQPILAASVVAAATLACHPAAYSTVYLGQTNFLILALVCLLLMARSARMSGLWPAVAITVKPWLAVLPLGLFVQGRWKAFGWFVFFSVVFAAVSGFAFGWDQITTYLFANPAGKMPAAYFEGSENQSLLGTLLRAGLGAAEGSPLQSVPWIVGVVIVFIVTLYLTLRLNGRHQAVAIALMICLGLIAYPATLVHYSVLLLIPLVVIGRHLTLDSPATVIGYTAFTGFVLLFVTLGAFFAFALVWASTCIVAWQSANSTESNTAPV